MKKICIIQPVLTSYRLPVFIEMAKYCQLAVIFSATSNADQGFGDLSHISEVNEIQWVEVPCLSFLGDKVGIYQRGIITLLRKTCPDAVILFSNFRYLSFWTTLFWCKIHKVPVFPHGHGLYKKKRVGFLWKTIYQIVLKYSAGYISYSPSVAYSLLKIGLPKRKIAIAENSLTNQYPVLPSEKSGTETGVLFIGRLRSGCRLELLINTMEKMHFTGYTNITLHVIGGGVELPKFRQQYEKIPWIIFYGECYDHKIIAEISRQCRAGCYPGNAGLSVVHMFSLSLPPITHNMMLQHQGPEPSYIVSGENGVLFEYDKPKEGISNALRIVFGDQKKLEHLRINAYKTYVDLTQPSLAARLFNIIDDTTSIVPNDQ